MTRQLIAALCLGCLTATAGWAQATREMPSSQYDEAGAKLMMLGYHGLRVVDANAGTMSGYDSDGSEVVLYLDMAKREIIRTIYVRDADS